ncbi:MAG TPA: hypothetical protein VLX09_05185 [Stellaceae bacterium]|nr:hypothetical protein [Stellaceae bacterium]
MTAATQTATLLTAQQIRNLAKETAVVEQQKAAVAAKKAEENREALRKAFMERQIRPDVMKYLMNGVKHHAEQGKSEFLVLQFSAELLTDGGRRVNNFQPDWPDSLQGFGRRAYDYFHEHLKPAGYKLHAQILDYPHGDLGDVGLFLSW